MGLATRIKAGWSAFRAGPPPGGGGSGGIVDNPWAGSALLAGASGNRPPTPTRLVEAYKGLIYTMAAINATAVSRVPLRLYATTSHGQAGPRCLHRGVSRATRERVGQLAWVARSLGSTDQVDEVLSHPILDALDDPNPEFDRVSLLQYLVLCLDVVGSAYINPVDGGFGPPAELWPLEPQYVDPVRTMGQARVESYRHFGKSYKPEELIRFRRVGLRDAYGPGYSPAQASWDYTGLETKWVTVQEELLGVARPGLLISSGHDQMPMGDPERARLDQQINRRLARGGGGGAIVSTAKLNASLLPNPPADPTSLQISRYDKEQIANAFGVPLSMLSSDTNLANAQAAHRQHAEGAVEPRCNLLATVLTRYARRFDPRLFFAFDDCLKEDQVERAKADDIRLKNGSLLINEARADDGRAAVAWGDEPWLASTLRQPSEPRPQTPATASVGDESEDSPSQAGKASEGDGGASATADAARSLARAAESLAALLPEREDGPGHFHRPHGAAGRSGRRWAADGRTDPE